jgi:hypothetical protein
MMVIDQKRSKRQLLLTGIFEYEKFSRFSIAEVVGSNPTLSIFIILVNYGIVLSLILTNCPTKTL